jgi:hypothetical protein
MKLKYYYKFLITDALLNTWEKTGLIFNVSVEEMSDIIKIIHPNKASGPDVISHKMLKLCPS